MKKLLVMLCCMGGFLLLSCPVFAQKGSCTYWGGSYTFKTYEPWLYEIVKQDKKEKKALASTNNQANIKNVWLELKQAQHEASSLQIQYQVALRYPRTHEMVVLEKLIPFNEISHAIASNALFKDKYAVLVQENNEFFLDVSTETVDFIKTLFLKDPKDRKGRPEPKHAWKDKYTGQVWVEFAVAQNKNKTLQICFDLAEHTIEFFDYEANFKKHEDTNLMDIADYHVFGR